MQPALLAHETVGARMPNQDTTIKTRFLGRLHSSFMPLSAIRIQDCIERGKRMKVALYAAGILAFSLTSASLCMAKGDGEAQHEYSTGQIHKMVREAHTGEQYTIIADYYYRRQQQYRLKAAEAMHLWADRNATVTPLSEKWPRPVDSARNLHDYYAYESSRSAALFAKYSALADAAAAQ
jgi:hypothetical protein